MKVAVYCITRDRLEYTKKSLKLLRKMAGCDIDLFVADNGSRNSTTSWLKSEKSFGNITYLKLFRENKGQNIAANHLIDKILENEDEYQWILRWDNDAIPRKLKNPATSVTVVRKMLEDWAGSWPTLVRMIGIAAPAILAITIDRIIATQITIARV